MWQFLLKFNIHLPSDSANFRYLLKKIKAYVHTKKVLHIIMTTFLVEKEVKKEETLNVNVITLYIKLFYYHF